MTEKTNEKQIATRQSHINNATKESTLKLIYKDIDELSPRVKRAYLTDRHDNINLFIQKLRDNEIAPLQKLYIHLIDEFYHVLWNFGDGLIQDDVYRMTDSDDNPEDCCECYDEWDEEPTPIWDTCGFTKEEWEDIERTAFCDHITCKDEIKNGSNGTGRCF